MDYEAKRLKIVLWTIVSLLILSVLGVSLLFIVKTRHDNPVPNPVNVGERISRADVSLAPDAIAGAGYDTVSDDGSTSIWHGANSHSWTGSGTQADPYLITKASELYGISFMVSTGTTYAGKYFKLDINLDMNGDTLTFTPIGNSSSRSFQGNFDGNGHSIVNLQIATDVDGGLFGYVANSTISNLNMEIIFTQDRTATFGGLADYLGSSKISNVNISYSGICKWVAIRYNGSDTAEVGGFARKTSNSTIENCTVKNFEINVDINYKYGRIYYGGGFANVYSSTITGCMAESYANIKFINADTGSMYFSAIGGLIGYDEGNNRIYNNNLSCGKLTITDTTSHYAHIGGMLGRPGFKEDGNELKMCNNLSQCDIEVINPDNDSAVAGLGNYIHDAIYSKYNIVNATIKAGSKLESAGGVDSRALSTSKVVYNKDKFSVTGASSLNTVGATSDANMKLRSTYADWEDFDTYWVVGEKANNGYPMLKKFIEVAKVTGFEGDGTENSPYLVKTHQDLLGLASYYNDNDLTKAEIYWKLANDIDVSKDSNNLPIHFTPICYNIEFDGYFDGNGKTISGLLIDNQYEYTGLFGTIGANHWVKNLTVKGNIYWDQAYAVGGVAGRVMNGGYLQNCKFDGNIIGVLNTKPSTECNGVVGKYELNGAVDCTAIYTDLKYAKIGGTTDAPTYTYYLYDWAQLTTSLYNKKVG